jgi:uncharacterized protein (TIGR00369 family)
MFGSMEGDAVPEGFEPWRPHPGPGFFPHNGPVYVRHGEGPFALGFRVLARHCNGVGTCHGGMLSFLADMLLIGGSKAELGIEGFITTISLHCDFVGAAPEGSWLEGHATVVRATGSLIFAEGRLLNEGKAVLRTNGILKRPGRR